MLRLAALGLRNSYALYKILELLGDKKLNIILGKTFHQETEDDFGSVSLDPRSDVAVLIKLFKCCNDIIQNLGLL